MSPSAAELLQRRHQELEGAPDPFPAIQESKAERKPRPAAQANGSLDNSDSAFPSLAPAGPAKAGPSKSAWGSGSASSAARKPLNIPQLYSSTFTLSKVDPGRDRDGKPLVLGNIMKDIRTKTKTKIEASTQSTGGTTFHIKGDTERAVDAAIRSITAALSPIVNLTVAAPISTIGTIIGPKGATLNKLREATGNSVKVDIPRRDPATTETNPTGEDEEEAVVSITVSGPASHAEDVRAQILAIIATKKSKTTQRVRDIPANVYPFIASKKSIWLDAADGEELTINFNERESEATVAGERETVLKTIEAIKSEVTALIGSLESISITIPKRQHRLLMGSGAQDLLLQKKCAVFPAALDEQSDNVTVWAQPDDISGALGAVYEKARSKHTHQVPIPGSAADVSQIQIYVSRSGYLKSVPTRFAGVEAFITPSSLVEKTGAAQVDYIGDKAAVNAASEDLTALLNSLNGSLRQLEIDWLVHKTIQARFAKKIKAFQENHNIILFFPPEIQESSTILLVHDPSTATPTGLSAAQKSAHLDEVQKELSKLATDAADVKTVTIQVDHKWHSAVVGKAGTTLNAIIGEDNLLSIKVGAQAKVAPGQTALGTDDILIRGPAAEVDRAVKEINDIVSRAQNDEIESGYTAEFDIARDYVGRVVGTGGSAVTKLREALGVSLDFSDVEADETNSKKKKSTGGKCHVKITGRKENVEEARKRILAQVEKLADETTEVLKIARSLHAGLIGQGGKYVIRLEEKYGVRINFPSDRDDDEADGVRGRQPLKPDEVLLRGGRKGVSGAKAEILEAVEYEKESNNTLEFSVPSRAVARILGKGGASINAIKDEHSVQIDVEKASESDGKKTSIVVRGGKKAIAAARDAILAISNEVTDEIEETVEIDHRYHRNIIGAGGQNLRTLITDAGGPSEPRSQVGLVHFPRADEPANEVRLRGPKAVVSRIKAALEKIAKDYNDRVVVAIAIPQAQHRALIGRGGQNLTEFQTRTGTTVQFPGSRSYHSAGTPDNLEDLGDVDSADLVKVLGPSAAVAKAIEELRAGAAAKTSSSEARTARERAPAVTATFTVPLKYHHNIMSQNGLFRTLRNHGVTVEHSKTPSKPAVPPRPQVNGSAARIDDDYEDDAGVQWQVVQNYQDSEEGESEWTLKGRNAEGLEEAQRILDEALENAKAASSIGYLTVADRSAFPRIVGAKGSTVARLRDETGAHITVGREDNTIVIVGSQQAITSAKEAILKIVNGVRDD